MSVRITHRIGLLGTMDKNLEMAWCQYKSCSLCVTFQCEIGHFPQNLSYRRFLLKICFYALYDRPNICKWTLQFFLQTKLAEIFIRASPGVKEHAIKN